MRNAKTCMTALLFGAAIVFGGAVMASAEAKLYRYASYLPPKHNLNSEIENVLTPLKESTGGAVEWQVFPAGQLFGPRGVIDGLGKRVADGAFVILNYYASQLPRAFTLVEMSTLGGRPETNNMVGAEAMLFNCPGCREDYEKQGVIWMSGFVATPQVLLCAPMVRNVGELKGLKVRTSGAAGPIVKELGATPVGMTSAELYTGMERGQIDCVLGSESWLLSHRLIEKVKSVLHYPFIGTRGFCIMCVSKQAWGELPDDVKKKLFTQAVKASSNVTLGGYVNVAVKAKKEAIKQGIVWTDGTPELGPFMKAYNDKLIPKIVKKAERRGLKDAKGFIEWHEGRQAHYAKLDIPEGISYEAYEKILWDNVYNKVDPTKHWSN